MLDIASINYIRCYALLKMTAGNLIKILKNMDSEKIVVLTEPSGIGWTNISKVVECACDIQIIEDGNGLFHD